MLNIKQLINQLSKITDKSKVICVKNIENEDIGFQINKIDTLLKFYVKKFIYLEENNLNIKEENIRKSIELNWEIEENFLNQTKYPEIYEIAEAKDIIRLVVRNQISKILNKSNLIVPYNNSDYYQELQMRITYYNDYLELKYNNTYERFSYKSCDDISLNQDINELLDFIRKSKEEI